MTITQSRPVAVFTGGDASITSASFNVTEDDIIVVDIFSDSTFNAVASDSFGFTWAEGGEELMTPSCCTRWARATSTQSGITVSATVGSINSAGHITLYHGCDPADPLGSINNGTDSNGDINVGLSTGDAGSALHTAGTEHGGGNVPTSSDCVEIAGIYNVGGSVFAAISAGRVVASPGPATNNMSIPVGATWSWTATEFRPEPTVPEAPVIEFVSAGNQRIYVKWTIPANGGAAITDYLVETSPNGSSSWTTVSEGTSTDPFTLLTGQTNGTAQFFRVSAINSVGTGSASAVSASVTPNPVDDFLIAENNTEFRETEDAQFLETED